MDSLKAFLISRKEQVTAFARALIQTPSVNGVHPESAVAEVIRTWSEQIGLQAQIVGDQPERPNVIVTLGEGQPGLILVAHLDTVAPGDVSRWTHPPFEGAVADGKVYGRGAFDTKGGIAAALFALAALQDWGGLRGSVRLIGVPDEESGATGTMGIKWLDAHGLLRGSGAIYCYGGHEIILGHRGLYRCRITCYGESAHPGFQAWQDGERGANAVTGMARLLLALEALPTEFSHAPYFERFRTVFTPGTLIEGGTAINMVPDRCTSTVDVRLTPEVSSADVRAWINDEIERITNAHPRLRFEVEALNDLPAALSDPDAPLFGAVEHALRRVTGETPVRTVAGPANEGYLLIKRGIPTVCGFGAVGANAHSIDEYVTVDSLIDAALMYALTAVELDQNQQGDHS